MTVNYFEKCSNDICSLTLVTDQSDVVFAELINPSSFLYYIIIEIPPILC